MKTRKSVDVVGPGKVPVTLKINGALLQAELEPCITLVDALREVWGSTGAKRACDRASCGACTILVDGKRVYACSLLAIDLQDSEITTVEGLGAVGTLDLVQQAFLENDAMQCGFCTPGFVMSCKGFLAENPRPTRDEVLKGMSGNICRCGSYVGIEQAVSQAAAALQHSHQSLATRFDRRKRSSARAKAAKRKQ